MITLGSFSLYLAFALVVYALAASIIGILKGRERLQISAYRATLSTCVLVSVAVGVLWYKLFSDDFTLMSVAAHSNRSLPWFYKLTALWSGQEGSLLFWSWILSGYVAIAVWLNRKEHRQLMPYVVAILSIVQLFFLVLNVFIAHPFQQMAMNHNGQMMIQGPLDGQGLNPLLQYPAMAIHPPMIYLGYIGFSVPFAFAMATLLAQQAGEKWIETTRRWTMTAWLFLSVGVLLGGRWAYAVLGWGGYWGWDPVENASFMPWLTGTAFLHSVMMQEKRGMMKVWNMVLIFVTFYLCIFGTFLTRSGVVSSVHAFAQSAIGPYFVGFLGVSMLISGWLLMERLDYLRSAQQLDSLVSRESSFLFNNLLLLASCFAVLWGTLFPVITEAVQGTKISVGAPFFNKVNVPIGLLLLALTGLGPLFAWRKTSISSLKKNFLVPAILGLAVGAALFVAGVREFYPQVSFMLCAFVTVTIVMEFARGSMVIADKSGISTMQAAYTLTMRNTRRYGGYIVHFGMVLIFLGITGAAFDTEKEQELGVGERLALGPYEFELKQVVESDNANYASQHVELAMWSDGEVVDTLRPERRFYKTSKQATTEAAIRPRMNEDLYVIFSGMNDANQKAVVAVHRNPLVNWIWLGGLILVLGTVVCLVPSKPGLVAVRRKPTDPTADEDKEEDAVAA